MIVQGVYQEKRERHSANHTMPTVVYQVVMAGNRSIYSGAEIIPSGLYCCNLTDTGDCRLSP